MDKKQEFEKLIEKYGDNYQWTINQHYVPQFYLKYFSNNDGKLETFDIKRKKILKPQSPDHVCSGKYFYSVKTGEKDKISQLLEDCFGEVESEYSKINEDIIKNILNYNEKIDEKLIFNLCEFVTLSYLRSLHFRETLNDMASNVMLQTLKRFYTDTIYYNPEDPKCLELKDKINKGDFKITFDNSSHIKFIFENFADFSNMFFSKKINILISDGERNFVTGDCCVKEVIPEIPGPFGVSFWERIHYFALTPKILIEFYDQSLPGKKIKRQRVGKWDVIFYNYFGSWQGNYLYSKSKIDLNIEEFIRSNYMFLEKLHKIYPSRYKSILDGKKKIIEEAMKKGFRYDEASKYYCDFMTKRKYDYILKKE